MLVRISVWKLFDSVDRCFAAMAAAGFVGFIAVLVGRAQLSYTRPARRNARGGTVELLKEFAASRRRGVWRGAQGSGAETWRGRPHP